MTADSKEGTLLDRTLPGHGSVPVKDIYSPPQNPAPAAPAADSASAPLPGAPRPSKFSAY
jgi:hypothetical protein